MPMRRIKCLICGTSFFHEVSTAHIEGHGLTPQEYKQKYGPVSYNKAKNTAKARFTRKEMADILIEAKASDLESQRASSELRIMNAAAREKVVDTTMALVEERRRQQKEDEELLTAVMSELRQPWRLKTNTDGSPVDTGQILKIGQFALQSMKLTSDTMSHTLNALVADNKSIVGRPYINQVQSFSGELDRIPMDVKSLTPQDREKVRLMVEALEKVQQRLSNMSQDDRQKLLAAIERQSQVVMRESKESQDAGGTKDTGVAGSSGGEKAGGMPQGV